MSVKAHYVKIGVFVVLALATVIVGIIIFGAAHLFESSVLAETYFDQSVQGLEVGSDVKHRGVKIGRIKEIDFVHQHYKLDYSNPKNIRAGRYIRVVFTLSRGGGRSQMADIETLIANGLRIRADTQGITGTLLLQTDYRDNIKPGEDLPIYWQPDNIYIPSTANTMTELTTAIQGVFARINNLDIEAGVDEFRSTMNALRQAVNDAKVGELSTQVSTLLTETRASNAQLKALLESEDMKRLLVDSAASAGHIRTLSGDLATTAPPLMKNLGQTVADLDRLVADTAKLVADESLKTTFANTAEASRTLNHTLVKQDQALDDTMRQLNEASRQLNDLLGTLKAYPSLLLFGDAPRPTE